MNINLPKNNLLCLFIHADGTVFKTEAVIHDFALLDQDEVIEKLSSEHRALLNEIKNYVRIPKN